VHAKHSAGAAAPLPVVMYVVNMYQEGCDKRAVSKMTRRSIHDCPELKQISIQKLFTMSIKTRILEHYSLSISITE
jgi:hypothetical protein